ncbi:MAG: DUF4097 domain-containing protein [Verrucomicrobia bacterium]|nr:DUF4097 domain-containing protein [Verrucomicrobiota bacterium]
MNRKHPCACCWAGLAVLSAALSAHADLESNLQKSFTCGPGGRLTVEADRGSIELTTHAADRVDVQVLRKVTRATEKQARDILENHEVTFAQEGSEVAVRARLTREWSTRWWRTPRLEVRYRIAVPRRFNLALKTAGGAVSVPDLEGDVKAQTAGGSIKTGQITGPVWCRTAGGGITIDGASGVIDAHTAGGSIRVGEAATAVQVGTSGGSIHIQKAQGRVQADTSGGSITVEEVHGPIAAQTSGGSIRVGFAGSLEEDCRLETSGGSVRALLPESVSLNVDARTSGGTVHADLPVTVQGEQKRSALVGRIGAGGKSLRLRTSGGSIYLQKR